MKNTNTNSSALEDVRINVKIKLSALWASLMFLYIYADYFEMKTPGVIDQMINLETPMGPVTPNLLVIFSMILIVPSLMIFLSIFLKASFNKWLNVVVAGLWSLMSILILISLIGNEWHMFYVLYQAVELVVFGLIIQTALTWPKNDIDTD